MTMDTMQSPAPAPEAGGPVHFDVEYPESLNRWLNNPFLLWIKWILAIPHFLILYALLAVVYVIIFIAFFAILFTKKFPQGLFDFTVNTLRWQSNVTAYISMMRDEYPPFSWDAGKYPLTLEIDYPESLGRFAPWYKWILVIPNFFVLMLAVLAAGVLLIVASFAILFTGKFPQSMFDFIVGVNRWGLRANGYAFYLLTDSYPPFGLK